MKLIKIFLKFYILINFSSKFNTVQYKSRSLVNFLVKNQKILKLQHIKNKKYQKTIKTEFYVLCWLALWSYYVILLWIIIPYIIL